MEDFKIYFDMEFTGLNKDCKLISVGMVSDSNQYFYGEIAETINSIDTYFINDSDSDFYYENIKDNLACYNNELKRNLFSRNRVLFNDYTDLRFNLINWLNSISEGKQIQFVGDVCHYDMVLLIDLLGRSALTLPENISPVCYDINMDIMNVLQSDSNEIITLKDAFNVNREQFLGNYFPFFKNIQFSEEDCIFNKFNENNKHNSLYDAFITKAIYNEINK